MPESQADRISKLFPLVPMDPDMPEAERDWLAEGLLMEGKINVMFGPEKAGKSRALGWILIHALVGKSLWDNIPVRTPGHMLYLLGEESQNDLVDRLRLYSEIIDVKYDSINWGECLTFIDAAGMRLDLPNQRKWLANEIQQGKYDTVIVDPIRRVHGARESDNDEMSKIFNDFRTWTNKFGLTLILVHHTGKLREEDDEDRIATWSRGATDLPAVLDWATYVRRYQSGKGRADRIIIKRAGRAAGLDPLVLWDHGDKKPGWNCRPTSKKRR